MSNLRPTLDTILEAALDQPAPTRALVLATERAAAILHHPDRLLATDPLMAVLFPTPRIG